MTRSPRALLVACAALLPLVLGRCTDLPTDPPIEDARFAKAPASLDQHDFDYTIVRHPQGHATWVNKMNARGDIVGDFHHGEGSAGRFDGYLLRRGEYTTISYPSSSETYAYGINERGDVVGHYASGAGPRGYLYSAGDYVTLPAPAGYHTRAYDISATGVIVGSYHTGTGKWQPAVWEKGEFVPLTGLVSELGADMAEGFGINVHGDIVGHYTVAGVTFGSTPTLLMNGFVYRNGHVAAVLDYPGSGFMSCGWGIGVDAAVVGHYSDIATEAVAVSGYIWERGTFTARLVVPGAVGTYPASITPNGVIAGYAGLGQRNSNGSYSVNEWVGFTATRKKGSK
jgi:hypothetical protein